MTAHFTAVLEVTKTTVSTPTTDRYNQTSGEASRQVSDVARIVVRSETLEALQAKLGKHIEIISE